MAAVAPLSAPALTFSFSTTELRVVMRDGNPWFVAKDACAALTIVWKGSDSTGPLAELDDDERGVISIHTPGGAQQMVVISESGLYSLILRSRKPEAKRFRKWVTSEVLPAIRKTGRYEVAAPAPAIARETIAHRDLANITRIIHLIAHWGRTQTAWVQATWFALRRVTGTPAPERFAVADLPVIAAELRRISAVSQHFQRAVREAEALVIRRVLREGHDADLVVAEIRRNLLLAASEANEKVHVTLSAYEERDLRDLMLRKELGPYYANCDEPQPALVGSAAPRGAAPKGVPHGR